MKLSIITINRNNADGLRKTVESVVAQTLDNFEYIVIDGASTDGSLDVIKQYENKISYWVSEPDKGIYNAMNKGIARAKGEYLLFLNSGDCLVEENTLQNVLSAGLDTDIVYGYQYDDINGKRQEELCLDVPYISFATLKDSHIPHQSTFIRAALLKKNGGYLEHYKIISDWAFLMLALFKWNATIKRIPVFVSVYDTTGISSNLNKEPQYKERCDFLEREFHYFLPDYDRWERLNKTLYMRIIIQLRTLRNKWIRR